MAEVNRIATSARLKVRSYASSHKIFRSGGKSSKVDLQSGLTLLFSSTSDCSSLAAAIPEGVGAGSDE